MDRELIIRLLIQAGFAEGSQDDEPWLRAQEDFAALVVAAEREKILEMCKEGWWDAAGIRYHLEQQDAIRSNT